MKTGRAIPRHHGGLTMVEVLVALTVVAFGLLGLLGMQARALSLQKDAFDRRFAADMVAQFGERLRANHIGFTAGAYSSFPNPLQHSTPTPAVIAGCAKPDGCTPQELAVRDLTQWHVELRLRVPGAAAYVEGDPDSPLAARVTIAWPEPLSSGGDSVCAAVGARAGAALPPAYRCFQASVFP